MPCYVKLKYTRANLIWQYINWLSLSGKLLEITLDSGLKFEERINKICNIDNKKRNALHSFANHVSLDKQKMLLRAFIESQFSYCPLMWMFHSRTVNIKTNRLH